MSKLISFYGKVTCLVDEGKDVDVVYLNFTKAFDTVFLYWRSWLLVAWVGALFTG